jgi:glycosyltransferase involved in cell wall biosynthesis
MKPFSKGNIKRTLFYMRRNGLMETFYAARERVGRQSKAPYSYAAPEEETLDLQRKKQWENAPTFSIVVPAYRTEPDHFRAMIESVLAQTYSYFELIIIDASDHLELEQYTKSFCDPRIHYLKLTGNLGIAENTNQGIRIAKGDYIGLLDHDDMLTPDALYEMALRVEEGYHQGLEVLLLYSDEDKCNQSGDTFFEPHRKENFNIDLLLSNNYICHFMLIAADLVKNLKLRKEFEGSQDYDLALRCIKTILGPRLDRENENTIAHVPKVLYHWRAHGASTAENPQSKTYAYEAGQRAISEFVRDNRWTAQTYPLKHLGFYGINYLPDIFANRPDIAAQGGKLLRKGKIAGGRYYKSGRLAYQGLGKHDSGEMHKAVLMQDAYALDIRYICVNPKCHKLFEQIVGVPYKTYPESLRFDYTTLSPDTDWQELSMNIGKTFREAGYRLLWNPGLVDTIYN